MEIAGVLFIITSVLSVRSRFAQIAEKLWRKERNIAVIRIY